MITTVYETMHEPMPTPTPTPMHQYPTKAFAVRTPMHTWTHTWSNIPTMGKLRNCVLNAF